MSFNFDVDDGRHFKNPYEDITPDKANSVWDSSSNKIPEDKREYFKKSATNLINMLELTENEWKKWNDNSVYTGTTGMAYTLYHYGKVLGDPKYFDRAKQVLSKYSTMHDGKREITFICGTVGLLALKTVVNLKIDSSETEETQELIKKLKKFSKYVVDDKSGAYDELLYGRVGYLYALLFINSETSTQVIEDELIKEVVNAVIKSGKRYSAKNRSEPPLMYSWHDSEYLGGAHGLAGILYLLLQTKQHLTETQLTEEIEPSLQYLLKLRYKSRNFPSSVGSTSDRLVHWCHGAPSMTMLFCLAHEVFGKEEYLQTALDCGEVVWTRGLLKKGYSICHGVAGNAYTFLTLFQKTKDPKYLHRAIQFGEWIAKSEMEDKCRIPDRPLSLFEGKAGHAYFFIDLLEPLSAKFPAYTL